MMRKRVAKGVEKALVRMRFVGVALIALVLMISSNAAVAQDEGLHNDTKEFTKHSDMIPSDIDDPDQIAHSWASAIIRVPTVAGMSKRTTLAELQTDLNNKLEKFPTAIYLHGCSGIWAGSHRRIKFLADNGFLVFAPASLARTKYPMSCNPKTHQGGLYRPTLKMRQLDAANAIEKAKALPFVDSEKVILIGFSQGGVTAATFSPANQKQSVTARVIEGWTCTAGWEEYDGINAPESEPVLSLVGKDDPWFQNEWTRGDCGKSLNSGNGSRSIVYENHDLAKEHSLLDFRQAQNEVLGFLKMHVDFP